MIKLLVAYCAVATYFLVGAYAAIYGYKGPHWGYVILGPAVRAANSKDFYDWWLTVAQTEEEKKRYRDYDESVRRCLNLHLDPSLCGINEKEYRAWRKSNKAPSCADWESFDAYTACVKDCQNAVLAPDQTCECAC